MEKMFSFTIIVIIFCGILFLSAVKHRTRDYPLSAIVNIEVIRSKSNPLITLETSNSLGGNINGPSVIRVPVWIRQPHGKYYMYFAHHWGNYIRLAYADTIEGPWKIYEPGTLKQNQVKAFSTDVAAPDVHIDNEKKEIRMYFRSGGFTGVAVSKDGINFTVSDTILGKFYLRAFLWQGAHYAIAKDKNTGWGELLRSPDGLTPFERRGKFIRMMRHVALLVRGDNLIVLYSRKGDAPERILALTVLLNKDWRNWIESEPIDVIRPEKNYEGIDFPNKPSKYGLATKVRQLRDPCIFEDSGKTYLFYTVAGEMGIAMAEISFTMKDNEING